MNAVKIICTEKTYLALKNDLGFMKEFLITIKNTNLYSSINENMKPVSPLPEPVSPLPEPVSPLSEPVSPLPEPVSPLPDPVSPLPEPVSPLSEPSETRTELEKSLKASDDQENISQIIKNDKNNSLWNDTSVKLMLTLYEELNPDIYKVHEPSVFKKLWEDITKRLADAGYLYTTKQVENTYRSLEITSILSQNAFNNRQ